MSLRGVVQMRICKNTKLPLDNGKEILVCLLQYIILAKYQSKFFLRGCSRVKVNDNGQVFEL